jgi:hypothetical protein
MNNKLLDNIKLHALYNIKNIPTDSKKLTEQYKLLLITHLDLLTATLQVPLANGGTYLDHIQRTQPELCKQIKSCL